MKTKLLVSAYVLLTMICGALLAQDKHSEDSNTRSVEGVVSDAASSPVAKATVQLKDTKSLQIRSFITEANGGYHFAGLSTNVEYELQANFNGVSSSKKTLDVFNTQKTATINLKLKK